MHRISTINPAQWDHPKQSKTIQNSRPRNPTTTKNPQLQLYNKIASFTQVQFSSHGPPNSFSCISVVTREHCPRHLMLLGPVGNPKVHCLKTTISNKRTLPTGNCRKNTLNFSFQHKKTPKNSQFS